MYLRRRLLSAALVVFGAASVFAQDAPHAAKPEIPGVAHVAVMYNDLEAAHAFMLKLGFEVGYDVHLQGQLTQYLVKVNDHQWIEVHPLLASAGVASTSGREIQPPGYSHICFETTDVKAAREQWATAGLNPVPIKKAGGDKTEETGAKSPDGKIVEEQQFVPDSMAQQQLGQHLGADRISKWLLGVDLPVPDVRAMRRFYEAIGFVGAAEGDALRMSPPDRPQVRVVLRPEGPGVKPKLLFAVENADKAAKKLSAAGFAIQRGSRQVSIKDFDGNEYVFIETGLPLHTD